MTAAFGRVAGAPRWNLPGPVARCAGMAAISRRHLTRALAACAVLALVLVAPVSGHAAADSAPGHGDPVAAGAHEQDVALLTAQRVALIPARPQSAGLLVLLSAALLPAALLLPVLRRAGVSRHGARDRHARLWAVLRPGRSPPLQPATVGLG